MPKIDPLLELRNAIIARAVYDYEMLISDAPIPASASLCQSEMTIPAIRSFAKGTEIEVWLNKIDRIYREEFKPYAEHHTQKIISAWERTKKKGKTKYDLEEAIKENPNKCPLCGGVFRPMTICGLKVIGCTGCYLNVRQNKKRKR